MQAFQTDIIEGSTGHKVVGKLISFVSQDDARQRVKLMAASEYLLKELSHLVRLMEPLEESGQLNIPGLATLNGARLAIKKATG